MHHTIYLCIYLVAASISQASNDIIFTDDNIFVQACQSNNSLEPVAVKEVSYMLMPENSNRLHLDAYQDNLKLSSIPNTQSLLSFKNSQEHNGEPYLYTLHSSNPQIIVRDAVNKERNKCLVAIDSLHGLDFEFKPYTQHPRASSLYYCLQTNKAQITDRPNWHDNNYYWTLQPAYKFHNLNPSQVDPDSLLFKLAKREDISNKLLSKQQLYALYRLKYRPHVGKVITVVHETPDYLYVSTPELTRLKGVFIMSEDFSLKVSVPANFYRGKGASNQEAEQIAIVHQQHDFLEINKGEKLFVKPCYQEDQISLPLMGTISIVIGRAGVVFGASYNSLEVNLSSIILGNHSSELQPNFGIQFRDNTINFYESNKNVVTNPGTALFMAQHAAQNVIKSFEATGLKLMDAIGQSIETASTTASQALLQSSNNFTEGMKISVTTLDHTVTFAAQSFENAINLIALTARGISDDVNNNIPIVLNSLKDTTILLSSTLKNAADKFKESSEEISLALQIAALSFEVSSNNIGHAVTDGSENLAAAMEQASVNFIAGMTKVTEAAEKLQRMNHNVTVSHKPNCIIS